MSYEGLCNCFESLIDKGQTLAFCHEDHNDQNAHITIYRNWSNLLQLLKLGSEKNWLSSFPNILRGQKELTPHLPTHLKVLYSTNEYWDLRDLFPIRINYIKLSVINERHLKLKYKLTEPKLICKVFTLLCFCLWQKNKLKNGILVLLPRNRKINLFFWT